MRPAFFGPGCEYWKGCLGLRSSIRTERPGRDVLTILSPQQPIMPPKQAIFVHHDQDDGKLSRGSAKKAWAHIGSRAWQAPSQNLRIKMWKPRKGAAVETQDDQGTYDEARKVAVRAYERLQTCAYRDALRTPTMILNAGSGIVEMTFIAVGEHSRRVDFFDAWHTPEQEIEAIRANQELNDFQFG